MHSRVINRVIWGYLVAVRAGQDRIGKMVTREGLEPPTTSSEDCTHTTRSNAYLRTHTKRRQAFLAHICAFANKDAYHRVTRRVTTGGAA